MLYVMFLVFVFFHIHITILHIEWIYNDYIELNYIYIDHYNHYISLYIYIYIYIIWYYIIYICMTFSMPKCVRQCWNLFYVPLPGRHLQDFTVTSVGVMRCVHWGWKWKSSESCRAIRNSDAEKWFTKKKTANSNQDPITNHNQPLSKEQIQRDTPKLGSV